ncbi:MAG: hypothetical protein AAFP69_11485, partial [Planctomycetota bacterium]
MIRSAVEFIPGYSGRGDESLLAGTRHLVHYQYPPQEPHHVTIITHLLQHDGGLPRRHFLACALSDACVWKTDAGVEGRHRA